MSWILNTFQSLFSKPDKTKCDANKAAEKAKHEKLVKEENDRYESAMKSIENSVICKVGVTTPVEPAAPVAAPMFTTSSINEPAEPPAEEPNRLMGGKKSRKARRNKKKKTRRTR